MNTKKPENKNSEFIAFGVTRRYGKLIANGDKHAVEIETDIRDEKRLQVFLSKSMSATSIVEAEVENMSDEAISKYLEILDKCYVTVTPNAPHEPRR